MAPPRSSTDQDHAAPTRPARARLSYWRIALCLLAPVVVLAAYLHLVLCPLFEGLLGGS